MRYRAYAHVASLMTVDQFINVGILIATVIPFTYTLHIANVRRGERQSVLLRDIQKRLKKHDKRVKALHKRTTALEQSQ